MGLLVFLVGCDHATKHAAKAQLEGTPPRQVVPRVLDVQYVENTDTAFNLLRAIPESTRKPLLIATSVAMFAALGLVGLRRARRPVVRVALLLVTAGAIGNTLDRVVRGYVVDFMHLAHWPVFNVADVYITVGAVLLAGSSLANRTPSAGVAAG